MKNFLASAIATITSLVSVSRLGVKMKNFLALAIATITSLVSVRRNLSMYKDNVVDDSPTSKRAKGCTKTKFRFHGYRYEF